MCVRIPSTELLIYRTIHYAAHEKEGARRPGHRRPVAAAVEAPPLRRPRHRHHPSRARHAAVAAHRRAARDEQLLHLLLLLLLTSLLKRRRRGRQRAGDGDGDAAAQELDEEARRVAGVVEAAVQAPHPLQPRRPDRLLQLHPPPAAAEHRLEVDPEVDPPVEVGRLRDALEPALLLQHGAAVGVAPRDDGEPPAALDDPGRTQPLVVPEERLGEAHPGVDVALGDPRELAAEVGEPRVVARADVGAERGHEAARGGVHEHRGELDDLLRVDPPAPLARRLEVHHHEVVELPSSASASSRRRRRQSGGHRERRREHDRWVGGSSSEFPATFGFGLGATRHTWRG